MRQKPRNERGEAKQLDLYSLRHLEAILRISREELKSLASRAGRYYSPFSKNTPPQPFPKKLSTQQKIRLIDNPVEPLKSVQDRVYRELLKPLVLPEHLLGGMPGKTIKNNVLMHLGAKVLITIDIKGFFPSISAAQIYEVWRRLLNCSPQIARLLTQLTTRNGHLPQGAATSTLLANLVLASFDDPIRKACVVQSIRYSSWIDDLAFSGGDATRDITSEVIKTLNKSGFAVKHRKIHVMGAGSKKVLNNILLSKVPSLERSRLDQLRSGIYKLKSGQVTQNALDVHLKRLKGQIGFVKFINPRKGIAMERQLQEVLASQGSLQSPVINDSSHSAQTMPQTPPE